MLLPAVINSQRTGGAPVCATYGPERWRKHSSVQFSKTVAWYGLKNALKEACVLIFRGA